MNSQDVRSAVIGWPGVTEEPHHRFTSFRVAGKIFATMPPDGEHVHIFVGEPQRELMTSAQPEIYEKLWWGKKVVGLRCRLSGADLEEVAELLRCAWQLKAPTSLRG